MTIWLTSDTHFFFHGNVIKYCNRPFSSVEEMNEKLIYNWNSVVTPDDTVYFLGDFSLAIRPVETITPRLLGRKILIPGNHDFCHSYNKKSRKEENKKKWIEVYTQYGWEVLEEIVEIELEEQKFLLSHLPYEMDNHNTYDDKFKKYRPQDQGVIQLCGHVHEKWKKEKSKKDTLIINVGVDVWDYTPVSLKQVFDEIL